MVSEIILKVLPGKLLQLSDQRGWAGQLWVVVFFRGVLVLGVLPWMVVYSCVSSPNSTAIVFHLNIYEAVIAITEVPISWAHVFILSNCLWRAQARAHDEIVNGWQLGEVGEGGIFYYSRDNNFQLCGVLGLCLSLVWLAVIAGSLCQTNCSRWSQECEVPVVHNCETLDVSPLIPFFLSFNFFIDLFKKI